MDCLDVVANMDVAEGRPSAALRLFAIVDATRRRLGLEISTPDERRERERSIALARGALDPEAIAVAENAAIGADITAAALAVLREPERPEARRYSDRPLNR